MSEDGKINYIPLSELQIGETIYDIGFSQTREARYQGRPVVLKTARRGRTKKDTNLSSEAIHQEAEILRRLHHPGIVQLIGQLEPREKELPSIILEYIDGRTFEEVLNEGGFGNIELVLSVFSILAKTVAYCHHLGIVHRDIRPANIILSPTLPILIDFGISQFPESDTCNFEYLSPENCYPQSTIGPESDVFSLATTVYFGFTGEHPVLQSYSELKKDEYAVRKALKKNRPMIPLEERIRGLPNGLPKIIASMLRYDPLRRPTMTNVACSLGLITRKNVSLKTAQYSLTYG